jgi:putative membrane-bound dehydrogenase-like protein
MWIQNEDVAHLTNIVERHSFEELLSGFQPPASSPTQSLAAIQVPAKFVVELVAAEPVVQSPVFLDWGEDGRMWVVEMRDYPLGIDGQAGGVVKRLEDADGDGYYEKATVFADRLHFPNGLLPWRKGVLISAAPDILYAEDTDGDGRADKIEKLFTGFGVWNQQHLLNGFDYGPDNWLYGANGDSGGTVTSMKTGEKVSISGRDFRFRPDTGEFETIAGQTQFGRHRDDWGNWFGNSNPTWLYHYWIPEHYVRRNRKLAVDRMRRETANYPEAGRVFAIGRKQQRLNDVGMAGHVTSANSPTPYRDDLFGPDFADAVFISEPVHNLVRCEMLHPAGVSFTSTRWSADSKREFLCSTDPWFRPTGMRIGPDGALYVADMYRQYIEHPEWIPEDLKRRVNLRAGEDRGRIYRVYPKGATLRRPPRLDSLSVPSLVEALDHRNGWQRDTVQRLLVARRDVASVEPLRRQCAAAASPKVRLQALCTLDGLEAETPELLVTTLKDGHPSVREHAIRICERALRAGSTGSRIALTPGLIESLLSRATDESLRVRFQLALSLGEWDDARAASALAEVARHDATNADVIAAIKSSAARRPAEIFAALVKTGTGPGPLEGLISHLVLLTVAQRDGKQVQQILATVRPPADPGGRHAPWQLSAYAQCLQELERTAPAGQRDEALQSALAMLPPLLNSARNLAADDSAPAASRMAALGLLGRDSSSEAQDADTLAALLNPRMPLDLQAAVLSRLGQLRTEAVARSILQAWPVLSPSLRQQSLDVILRRPVWIVELLGAVESKKVTLSELGASVRQRLLAHTDEAVRRRARQLLAGSDKSSRVELVTRYLSEIRAIPAGDAGRGSALYLQHCAACHRLRGEGLGAAPDLASVVDRAPERMLIAILDPNRAVEDRYVNYVARVRGGDEFSGMLASENANSVTLVGAGGGRETILRTDLESLTSTRLSLMPEGFEQFLSPRDIADILAHIK